MINDSGPLSICGKTIPYPHANHGHSAVEAMCVNIQGNTLLQLARQLASAALNCIMTIGDPDCDGTSIEDLFDDCNAACAAGNTTIEVDSTPLDCISALDCVNNGGIFDAEIAFCQTGTCSDNQGPCNDSDRSACLGPSTARCVTLRDNCHDLPLVNEDVGLDFDPESPAGSSNKCTAAIKIRITIFRSP